MAFDPDAYIKSFEQKPTDEKSAPSFDPDEYIKGLEARLAEERKPKKAEDVGILEGTAAAFKRGFGSFEDISSGLGLAKILAEGDTESARKKMAEIKEAQQQEQELPSLTSQDIQRIYEEKGLLSAISNVPKYITENVAQSLPQMLTPLGAGAVAGKINPVLGAAVGVGTYGIQQFGNFLVRQAQEKDSPEELDVTKAALTAAGTAPLGYMADRFTIGLGSLGKRAGPEILKELSARELAAKVGKRVVTGATEGIIAEAPVEVLEQAAERYQAGLSLTDDSAMNEFREAFFGAAAAGGGLGGAAKGVKALVEKPEVTAVTPPETPPEGTAPVPPEGEPVVPPEGAVNPPIPGEPPPETTAFTPPKEPEPAIEPEVPTGPQKVSPSVELAPGEAVNPSLFQINKPYQQIAKEVTGMNVPQISNWAVENAPNEFAKYIAEKVATRIQDFESIGVPMTLNVQHGKDRRGRWYGMVQPRTGIEAFGGQSSYEMNLRGLDAKGNPDANTGTRYSTILHELIHVSTIAQLGRLGQQAKDGYVSPEFTELKNILNKVRAQVREDTKKADRHEAVKRINSGKEYTKDTDELIAYGFTDPVFQHYLSTVKMGDKSAFERFVEIIQNLLGIKREYKSALEALVNASNTLYKPSAKDIQKQMNKKGYNFGKPQAKAAPIKKSAYANIEEEAKTNVADTAEHAYTNATPQAQWHGPTESKVDNLLYKLQDKHIDTKRVIQAIEKTGKQIEDSWNVYLKEELYHGRTSSAIRKFLLQDILPTVKQMSKLGITPDELKTYMHNLHAEERNAQIAKINPEMPDKGSGISTQAARDYLAKLDPAKKQKLEEIAKKFQDMVQGTQKVLVDSGAETKETVDAWNKTYKNYVPLFRVDDDFATHPSQTGTGQGLSSRGGFSKRAMGSEKDVQDILGNIIAQRERALIRAEKIRVGRAMYGLAIKNPNTDFWLPVNPDMIKDPNSMIRELNSLGLDGADIVGMMMEPRNRYIYKDPRTGLETVALRVNPLERYKDNVFPVRVDGHDRYIFFNANDPRAKRMVEAMKNLDAEQLGTVEGMVAKATRWFSAVNTQYNPVFGGINLLRDIQGSMFNLTTTKIAGEQQKVLGGVFPAMRGIFATLRAERAGKPLPDNEWANLWADFKEQGGQTLYRDSLTRKAEEDQIIEQELKKLKSHNVKKAFGAAANMLSDFNDTIENSVRLSAYKAALDKGLSKEQAASIAKNLTVNFDRKGQLGSRINSLYAFFNASMQGSARLMETLKGPKGRKIIAGGIILGSAQAIAMAAAGFDEDEPPEFVKERNLIIPLPDKKYLMIPLPLGLHLLPNVGRVTTEFVLNGGKNPGKHVTNLMSTTMDAFNPLGGSGTALEMVAPSVLDPLVALGTNKDAFGRPIYKEDRATNPTPGYLRSRENASEISKLLSQFFNYASGGTEYQKGAFSPTADEIDYLAGQLTGGAGREIMKTEQAIKAAVTGEELPSYRIPLAGRFYGEGESQAAESQRFYENVTRMAGHENEIKGRAKNKGNVGEYMRENPEAKLWQMANDAENQISALNKQKKEFIARGFPKERIQALDKQKQMVMKRFNDRVRSLQD